MYQINRDGFINPYAPFYYERLFDPTPYPNETFVKLEYPYVSEDTLPYYYISNLGRVYSDFSKKIMRPSLDSKKYPIVVLSRRQGKCNAYRIHRLLMLIFNPVEGCENLDIHHKDSIKHNYQFDNLEWCTKSYNMLEAYRLGEITNLQGEDRAISKITNEVAREICRRIEKGDVMLDIAKDLNVDQNIIYSISNRKAWKSISKDYDFSKKNKFGRRTK